MPTNLGADPNTVLALGLIGSLLGALQLFGRRLPIWLFCAFIAVTLLLPWILLDLLMDMPTWIGWLWLAFAGIVVFMLLGRGRHLGAAIRGTTKLAQHPTILGGTLTLCGLIAIGVSLVVTEPWEDDFGPRRPEFERGPREFEAAKDIQAVTDRGTPIETLRLVRCHVIDMKRADEQFPLENGGGHLIRLSGPTTQCNCHGWVFTGGLCWIGNDSIDTILLENDYEQVEIPAPGDVVVYRNSEDEPMHSGIVRFHGQPGQIMVESKWGLFGVYIHFVHQPPDPGKWAFYRSSRSGHLLKGITHSPRTGSIMN